MLKRLGSARTSDIPVLDPTVRVGYEVNESFHYQHDYIH